MNSILTKGILIGLWLSIALSLSAQDKAGVNLIFGIDKGLKFIDTSAMPTLFKANSVGNYLNSAAISDKRGNLLMYYRQDTERFSAQPSSWAYVPYGYIVDSAGKKINGTDSIFTALGEDASCLLLPDPADSTVYWFFAMENNPYIPDTSNHLMYIKFKVINDSINVLQRNDYAYSYGFRNALRAIKHGNGRDWWLISKNDNANIWVRFLLTPTGLSTPMFQTYGTLFYLIGGFGSLSPSVDGKHILFPYQTGVTSFDFDRCTGLLSNYQHFDDGTVYNQFIIQNYYQSVFYDTTTKTVIAGGNQNIIEYSLNTTDTFISKYKLIKKLSSYSDTADGNGYGTMFYNPLNPEHLYIYISQELSSCDFYTDSLRNTISLIQYQDTANIKVIDKFIITDTNEIFAPEFIQPNYNLGRLSGSVCDTIPYGLGTQEIVPLVGNISVFPNPTNYSVTVDMPYQGICTITDITGRQLETIQLQQGQQSIQLSQYANGLYLLNITLLNEQQGQCVVKKIVVQR